MRLWKAVTDREPAREIADLLRDVELFQGLDEKRLRSLASLFEEHTLRADEPLFREGDDAEHLFLVRDGFVDVVVKPREGGAARTLISLGRGQSVGEMCFLDRGVRSATVRAAVDGTVVASASFDALEAMAETCPRIGYRIMRNIAADLTFRLRHRDQEG